jgi:hypothetical protein
MKSKCRGSTGLVLMTLAVFLHAILFPVLSHAQAVDCNYDPASPSIENARKNFKITNYVCAEKELKDFLAQEDITLEDRANAHVLLASVYYAMMRDDEAKSQKVTEQFVAAFKAFRAWKGNVDIKSPEFLALMEKAKEMVDQESQVKKAALEQVPTAETMMPQETKSKPWYKKWWVLGLGVGVIAGAVVIAGGGGGGGETPTDNTLPGFPGTPKR